VLQALTGPNAGPEIVFRLQLYDGTPLELVLLCLSVGVLKSSVLLFGTAQLAMLLYIIGFVVCKQLFCWHLTRRAVSR